MYDVKTQQIKNSLLFTSLVMVLGSCPAELNIVTSSHVVLFPPRPITSLCTPAIGRLNSM